MLQSHDARTRPLRSVPTQEKRTSSAEALIHCALGIEDPTFPGMVHVIVVANNMEDMNGSLEQVRYCSFDAPAA